MSGNQIVGFERLKCIVKSSLYTNECFMSDRDNSGLYRFYCVSSKLEENAVKHSSHSIYCEKPFLESFQLTRSSQYQREDAKQFLK